MTTPAQRAHIEQVKQQKLNRIKLVISLTNQGMTQRQACDKLGLNHYVMSRNIRRWKREQMTAEEAAQDRINLQPKPDRNKEMRDRWWAGESLEVLSAHYGIHPNVCWRIIKREIRRVE